MKFSMAVATALCIATSTAGAVDLFEDGKPAAIKVGTPIAPGTTVSGYPLFLADGQWQFIRAQTRDSNANGDADAIKRGMATLARTESNGSVSAYMSVTVNLTSTGKDQYFGGKPCDGQHALTIDHSAGRDDNCAFMDIGLIPEGKQASGMVAIRSIQTASAGRLYVMELVIDPASLGVTVKSSTDWEPQSIAKEEEKRDFIARAEAWTEQLLKATRKAIDYKKPQDAFANLPPYQSIGKPKADSIVLVAPTDPTVR